MAATALCVLVLSGAPVIAQAVAPCGADGYRVVARRWDAVLKKGWEWKQNCAHPEWPARSVALLLPAASAPIEISAASSSMPAEFSQPVLVRAGETVTLWLQEEKVRIEMSGVAEESARCGEHVVVRVTHQSDDAGSTMDHIAGIVRGLADVEMER